MQQRAWNEEEAETKRNETKRNVGVASKGGCVAWKEWKIFFIDEGKDVRGKRLVNRGRPMGRGGGTGLELTIGGTGQSIRFQPACPIPTWCPPSDYRRSLGLIAHANFITTTLAPMGEPAIENGENEASTGREGPSK